MSGARPIRVGFVYDIDARRGATGVTRHAMAQLDRLRGRPEVALSVVSGRIGSVEGLAFWEGLDPTPRRELPLSTRAMLRAWRACPWPPVEWWAGPVDWVYAPSEYLVPTRTARVAVTSHDVKQDLTLGGPRRRALLARVFGRADRVLSVSEYNTAGLREAFPIETEGKVRAVPNGADDLFFEAAMPGEVAAFRASVGLPAGVPYLLSVANFQPRKNLARLVRAAGRLAEVGRGDLAIVLVGEGDDAASRPIREAIAAIGGRAVVRTPGYLEGKALRAAYDGATALVIASTCESFGIPAVEAMARGTPVALADSTALPEVGGAAGWYFPPDDEAAIASTLRDLLDRHDDRRDRAETGRTIAAGYRWSTSNDRLLAALLD